MVFVEHHTVKSFHCVVFRSFSQKHMCRKCFSAFLAKSLWMKMIFSYANYLLHVFDCFVPSLKKDKPILIHYKMLNVLNDTITSHRMVPFCFINQRLVQLPSGRRDTLSTPACKSVILVQCWVLLLKTQTRVVDS